MKAPSGPLGKVAVIIPTYNERENLELIAGRIHDAVPYADVLVVDDNSPDGTGKLAGRLAAADERIHVMHRRAKSGLGAAYLAGFAWGLGRGYDVLVEMDADGSHDPAQLPALLAGLAGSMTIFRRHASAAQRQLALGALAFCATGVVVLIMSDLFEFSWRYQLPALVTLPPAGAFGIAAVLRFARRRKIIPARSAPSHAHRVTAGTG